MVNSFNKRRKKEWKRMVAPGRGFVFSNFGWQKMGKMRKKCP